MRHIGGSSRARIERVLAVLGAGVRAPQAKGIEFLGCGGGDIEFKDVNDGSEFGIIEGYGATFNGVDRVADTILPGAFAKSIKAWASAGKKVPMLWQHNPDKPIGVWDSLVEDDVGLKVKGQMVMSLANARDARSLIKAGALGGLSIGYEVVDKSIDKTGVRLLKRIDLWEISPVTFPADQRAVMTAKSLPLLSTEEVRAFERDLKSAGFSQTEAVRVVGVLKKRLRDEGGTSEPEPSESAAEFIKSMRRLQDL